VAEITFNFWFVLSNEIAGSGKMLTDVQRDECKRLFAPLFLQLVSALRHLVEYPEGSEMWTTDMQDDFKRFRYSVGDAINDSCQVATSVAVIEQLFLSLQAALPAFMAAPHERWREVEAYIYCLRQSGTKEPTFFKASRVGELLQLLPSLPAVGELTTTAIRTVGTHSDWLAENPELLPSLLGFVSQGLTQDKTAAASSQAMKHLCEKCAQHLAEESTMRQLLHMYLGTLQLQLHTADRVDLIAAMSFVVSQMPLPQVLPAMQSIAHPLLARLRDGLQNGTSSVSEVSQLLDQICSLLREVSPSEAPNSDTPALQDALHPSVQMLQSIWDVLDAVFARHGSSSQCMEKLCRCYKHTARNNRVSFAVLVPKLLQQITSWYEQQPHSCFVYVVNWVLTSNSRQREFHPLFAESYRRVSNATFQLLSVKSTISDNPDVVDDYFELCSKVLRFMPELLLESELLHTVFQCGCAGLHIQHLEAGRSVTNFFEVLLSLEVAASGKRCARAQQVLSTQSAPIQFAEPARSNLRAVILTNGPALANVAVLAIAGLLPQGRVRFIANVLGLLVEVDTQASASWVEAAIKGLPTDAHIDGNQWMTIMFSPEGMQDQKELVKAAEAFSSACRRKKIIQ